MDPTNAEVYESLGGAFERMGMHQQACLAWRRAMTLAGDDELASLLSHAYERGGIDEAVRAISRTRLERIAVRASRGEYTPAIESARAYVGLGDDERALDWLERACGERNVFPLLLHGDPSYDGLRTNDRFTALMRAVAEGPAGRPDL